MHMSAWEERAWPTSLSAEFDAELERASSSGGDWEEYRVAMLWACEVLSIVEPWMNPIQRGGWQAAKRYWSGASDQADLDRAFTALHAIRDKDARDTESVMTELCLGVLYTAVPRAGESVWWIDLQLSIAEEVLGVDLGTRVAGRTRDFLNSRHSTRT